MRTITLNASAKFGYGGKEYIARITGRDPKFTFAREFVGTKGGKRRESAEYMTDEPGLYVTCDIDRKGNKDETYWLIERVNGTDDLDSATISKKDAMLVAKLLDAGKSFEDAVAEAFPPPTVADEIASHRKKLAVSEAANDPDGKVKLGSDLGDWKKGDWVRRGDLIERRKAEIARLEATLNPPAPEPPPAPDAAAVAFPDLFKN